MNIAIIGTGNIGGALATQWSKKGHEILLGVRDQNRFKGQDLLKNANTKAYSVTEAVRLANVILIATPPLAIFEILFQMGENNGKIINDATNIVRQSPEPYPTVFHAIADKTRGEVVKCFNTTGFENILNPVYQGVALDMFMAGDSESAKTVAFLLALDAGFRDCIDFGRSDKVELLEKFALAWVNLAIIQGQGRNIAFKVLRR